MNLILSLTKRNIKLFFKDKGMFLTSLITPVILLVLYTTFLGNVFRDSLLMFLPENVQIADDLLDGLVGGQLISSLLAVSCVTVAFCANFLMVQDKVNGTIKDLRIAPIRSSALSISYYLAALTSALTICLVAVGICLAYVAAVGWYMSVGDVLCLLIDVILLVMFGTALSSVINFFLSSQGQISAVGTMVSSGYGFICGAYMPLSSFSIGLQRAISFLPGTYGTALVRNHAMGGALRELEKQGISADAIKSIRDSLDCNLYFFDNSVGVPIMYLILIGTIAILLGVYILLNMTKKKGR